MQSGQRKNWLWIIFSVVLLTGGVLDYVRSYRVNQNLVLAETAFREQKWESARPAFAAYLQSHPNHFRSRLSLAEALIRDDKLQGKGRMQEALDQLKQIPDQTEFSADARILEGRIYLLMLLQPAKAEQALRRSLAEAPQRQETHSLLWKLYDLTDRWDLAEDHVWQIYDQTPPAHQSSVLRDWYLSEFCSSAVNMELDQFLGFLKKGGQFNETDRTRLQAFIDADPQWPEGFAILARWYQRKRDHESVRALLEQAERLSDASQSPLLISVRVAIDVEMGRLDHVEQIFAKWPDPKEGYEYWKTAGLVAEELHRNDQSACDAYNRALLTTPGRSDWRTMHRLAQCLTRLGQTEKSASVHQQSRQTSSLMDPEFHRQLRQRLVSPRDPQTISQMVDFYRKLGREREASAWQGLDQKIRNP